MNNLWSASLQSMFSQVASATSAVHLWRAMATAPAVATLPTYMNLLITSGLVVGLYFPGKRDLRSLYTLSLKHFFQ